MPYVTTRAALNMGAELAGIFRTAAARDAAAAAASDITAFPQEIADADLPMAADIDGGWWVYDALAEGASVSVQLGSSGKGFRLTWSLGATGTAGNFWTVVTGTAGSNRTAFNVGTREVGIPDPNESNSVSRTGSQLLNALNAQVGNNKIVAEYLPGTDATTDFSAISGDWRPFPETDTANDPPTGPVSFSGGMDARPAVHDTPAPTAAQKLAAWMERINGVYWDMMRSILNDWDVDDVGRWSLQATRRWVAQIPAAFYNALSDSGTTGNPNTDEKREALVVHAETVLRALGKTWYGVMRGDAVKRRKWLDVTADGLVVPVLSYTGSVYEDYITSTLTPRTPDGSFRARGVFPANYDPETITWV